MSSMFLWIPNVPDSIDGEPLATSIADMFWKFPYERLPENQFLNMFLRPELVVVWLVFYLVSKPLFQAMARRMDKTSTWFVGSVAIHNFVLAIFSALVAWNAWPLVYQHYQTFGFFSTYCDPNGTLWSSGFGAWSFVFYISKYYEFIDTWILVLKQKQPSFLQVYHHTGIAFCMWMGVLCHSPWLKYVVLLNSVIHTFMYTYFFIKTVQPTIEIKAAKNLTMAQIGQFLVGLLTSLGILYLGQECTSEASLFGITVLQTYVWGLVGLFFAFAKRKYKKAA